jgi:hypothetical protein
MSEKGGTNIIGEPQDSNSSDSLHDSGLTGFAFVTITHWPKLITLNLLFLMSCIPIITIPISFIAMDYVLVRLLRNGGCFLWSDYWEEWRSSFFNRVFVSALMAVVVFGSYMIASNLSFLLGSILFFSALFINLMTAEYWILLSAVNLVSPITNLRNAFALLCTSWKTSFLILLIIAASIVASYFYFPYSVPILLLGGFTFPQLMILTSTYGVISDRLGWKTENDQDWLEVIESEIR